MIPQVQIAKQDGNTGVVRPGVDGILAIIAPSEKGTINQPASYARAELAYVDFGNGLLVEAAAYDMAVSKNPVVLIRGTGSTAGVYGTVVHTGAGTSVVTATGTPLDDFAAVITFVVGGTVGAAGATYTYSLDGGVSQSAVLALGTAFTIVIPNTGITFSLAAGTVLAGQTEAVPTTGPRLTNADVVSALDALRLSSLPWESVLVVADADATMTATVDTWLQAREGEGRFKTAIMNTVMRTVAQTEATYATAMATASASMTSKSIVVGTDGGDAVSQFRGIVQKRPTSWAVAARGMAIDIARDPAYVSDGPVVGGFGLYDARGNPKNHDELAYPGLDALRLTTLRTFWGRQGTYINNALIISSSGSDYVYWQHTRVMNKACEITFQILIGRLSIGVRKNPSTGFILEEDAADIEGLVNAELEKQLSQTQRVSAVLFALSRTDSLVSNAGATLNGSLNMIALTYVKQFAVQSRFVKTIIAKT